MLTILVALTICPITAFAWGGNAYSPYSVEEFDYEAFAAMYPEVCAALGNNKQKVWDWGRATNDATTVPFKRRDVEIKSLNESLQERFAEGYGEDDWVVMGLRAKQKILAVSDQLGLKNLPERERVKAIHDWIIRTADFRPGFLDENYRRLPRKGMQGVVNGESDCLADDYNEVFVYFCQQNLIEAGWYWHTNYAWVKVDDVKYDIAVCLDDMNEDGEPSYECFLLPYGSSQK